MIRVYKHDEVPSSLTKQTSWSEEDVIDQLKTDQYGKCYLCERIQVTDFQVEHHKSRNNYPALKYEWKNLFWSCSYCNGKKLSSFDDLLNPIDDNIEELIEQSFDFPNSKVVFASAGLHSKQIDATIELLYRIFNGTNKFRKIREQQFYDYAMSKITSFQKMVISWLENKNKEFYNSIIQELDITSEFLGFKYWIIKSNELLFETFGDYIKWNKQ